MSDNDWNKPREMSQDELEALAKRVEELYMVVPCSPAENALADALARICWHLSQRP